MTTFRWQEGANAVEPGQTSFAAGVSLYIENSRVRVGPIDPAAPETRDPFSAATQNRLIGSLTDTLSGAFSRLNQRLDAVVWPSGLSGSGLPGSGLSGTRLVSVPANLSADLSATLNPYGVSSLEERLATTPRNGASASGMAAGTYALTLSLGERSDELSVSIGSGWTTGQIFDAVAGAVNASSLPVDALASTSTDGYLNGLQTLALRADASLTRLDVDLAATASASNRLASWLGLSAENVSPGSKDGLADKGVTNVTGLAAAKPTRYASQGFDPEAPTTLAPGNYTLDYLVGPSTVGQSADSLGESGSVSIRVSSGDTWRDVLSRMANVLGSASPAMVARLVPAKRVWDLPDSVGGQHGLADALGVEALPTTQKSGWRLRLSGADAASEDFLAALGMDVLAHPGSTGEAVIEGQMRESPTGTFSADSGRLTLGVSGTFGEAAPVRVIEGATGLADSLADVLSAYNDVGAMLTKSASEIRPGLADGWNSMAATRASALGQIGIERASQFLWLAEETFLTALLSRPDAVQETLLGAEGFLSALKTKTTEALAEGPESGVSSWISARAQTRAGESGPEQYMNAQGARTEIQVEKANQLLDLYDASASPALDIFEGGSRGPLLRRRG